MHSKCPINQLLLIPELTLDFPGLNPNSLLWSRLRLLRALSEASFRPGSISCPRCEIQLLESFDLQFFTSEGSALAGLAFAAGPDLTLEPWDLGRGLQARTGWHVEDPFPGVPGVRASVQAQHAPDSLFPLTADICSWHFFQAESHFATDFLSGTNPPAPLLGRNSEPCSPPGFSFPDSSLQSRGCQESLCRLLPCLHGEEEGSGSDIERALPRSLYPLPSVGAPVPALASHSS